MTGMLDAGGMFREVTATQVLLSTGYPRIRFVEFAADEEKENGANWLWWWVDRDGTCYGLMEALGAGDGVGGHAGQGLGSGPGDGCDAPGEGADGIEVEVRRGRWVASA